MGFNLSKTNSEAAVLTGIGAGLLPYLLDGEPIKTSIGLGLLAGLGVLGWTGYTPVQ